MAERRKREVPTPRQAIRDYCLMTCPQKEKKNSKRAVVECLERECPLHPYRTGQLRVRSGPLTEGEQRKRIERLEMARRKVTYAENNLRRATETMEFRREVFQKYIDAVEEKKKSLEDAKRKVRQMEEAFNAELEAGIWK